MQECLSAPVLENFLELVQIHLTIVGEACAIRRVNLPAGVGTPSNDELEIRENADTSMTTQCRNNHLAGGVVQYAIVLHPFEDPDLDGIAFTIDKLDRLRQGLYCFSGRGYTVHTKHSLFKIIGNYLLHNIITFLFL